jgi:hypothetical protein
LRVRPKTIARCGVSGLIFLTLLWAGCARSKYSFDRITSTSIGPLEGITVLLSEFSGGFSSWKERKFAGCVAEAVQKAHPRAPVVSPKEFRRAVFPGLAAGALPDPWRGLVPVVDDPVFRERAASLGLRYIVWLSGDSTIEYDGFEVDGGAGGGVLGVRWRRTTRLRAYVLDLKTSLWAGAVNVNTKDTIAVALVVIQIYPIPLAKPGFTEGPACRELGERVEEFLAGEAVAKARAADNPVSKKAMNVGKKK